MNTSWTMGYGYKNIGLLIPALRGRGLSQKYNNGFGYRAAIVISLRFRSLDLLILPRPL